MSRRVMSRLPARLLMSYEVTLPEELESFATRMHLACLAPTSGN